MQIRELAHQSGVSAKTIRYYESVGLLTPPARRDNNYRDYTPDVLDRLRFIVSARSLGFSLADIGDLLAAHDRSDTPCARVLTALDAQIEILDRRIADLLALRENLRDLRREGALRPLDKGASGQCVCYLVTAYRDRGAVAIHCQEDAHG